METEEKKKQVLVAIGKNYMCTDFVVGLCLPEPNETETIPSHFSEDCLPFKSKYF